MSNSRQQSLAKLGLTAAVAVVLLAPLGVFVWSRSSGEGPGLRGLIPDTSAPVTQKAKVKRADSEFSSIECVVRDEKGGSVSAAATAQQSAPPIAARPFPTSSNIPVGMDKSKLIASFGKPHMIATEVNGGRALQTFHYLQPEAGTETVVQLSGGRVVAVSTVAY